MLNLKVSGTIGILLKAKELKLIRTVKEILEDLIVKGTWINQELIKKALELANE